MVSQPANAPAALKLLTQLLDSIWYAAGDTASDSSWYTKRAALAGVYLSTELYMLTGVCWCVASHHIGCSLEFMGLLTQELHPLVAKGTRASRVSWAWVVGGWVLGVGWGVHTGTKGRMKQCFSPSPQPASAQAME